MINRKLQYILDISKFMAPGPLGDNTFVYRINIFVARNTPLLNLKSRDCEKLILQK